MGEVKRLTGLTERRIRYYESQGLLEPLRSPGHQRQYTAEDVERLKEIKRLLDGGVHLKAVKERLATTRREGFDEDAGDALAYFRARQWVRQGDRAIRSGPLAARPDVEPPFERDGEE
ncbi:MAG: MerR family transcriptional regulator [Actinomycetia bacterium]|nr:MerR family transcriptional regulator [Actinomycetes bacterium]